MIEGAKTPQCPQCGSISAAGCINAQCAFPNPWIDAAKTAGEEYRRAVNSPMPPEPHFMKTIRSDEYQRGFQAGALAMREAAAKWHEGQIGQLLNDHGAKTHGIQAAVHKSSAQAISLIDPATLKGE